MCQLHHSNVLTLVRGKDSWGCSNYLCSINMCRLCLSWIQHSRISLKASQDYVNTQGALTHSSEKKKIIDVQQDIFSHCWSSRLTVALHTWAAIPRADVTTTPPGVQETTSVLGRHQARVDIDTGTILVHTCPELLLLPCWPPRMHNGTPAPVVQVCRQKVMEQMLNVYCITEDINYCWSF